MILKWVPSHTNWDNGCTKHTAKQTQLYKLVNTCYTAEPSIDRLLGLVQVSVRVFAASYTIITQKVIGRSDLIISFMVLATQNDTNSANHAGPAIDAKSLRKQIEQARQPSASPAPT